MTDRLERLRAALSRDYGVEREMGGGGMSRVFLAEEMELGRRVVIKVLPPEMAAGVSIGRFRREIQLAAALQHPHIVPLLHAGHVGEVLYYTMPLIEGESLRAKLAREGALPITDTVRILQDVVDALAYAHRHGVAHRDIKPDNVLISDHHAVVTDFGVAKALGEATGETSLTSGGGTQPVPAAAARAPSGRRTRLAVYAGLAVLGLAAVSGVAFFARGHGDAGSHKRKLLVVLPFQNLGRPDDDYFADGITEEITARLGSLQELGVIARTTAVQYKSTAKTIHQLGQELGVDYALEGTDRSERPDARSSP